MNKNSLIDKYLSTSIYDPITNDPIPPSNEKYYQIHAPSGSILYPEVYSSSYRKKTLIGIIFIFIFMLLFSFQFTIYVENIALLSSVLHTFSLPFLYIGGILYGFWIGKQVRTTRKCM